MEEELTTREMRPEERRLLKDFLYEAVFVPEGAGKTTSPLLPAKKSGPHGENPADLAGIMGDLCYLDLFSLL